MGVCASETIAEEVEPFLQEGIEAVTAPKAKPKPTTKPMTKPFTSSIGRYWVNPYRPPPSLYDRWAEGEFRN